MRGQPHPRLDLDGDGRPEAVLASRDAAFHGEGVVVERGLRERGAR